MILTILFWVLLVILLYTYAGYALILGFVVFLKKIVYSPAKFCYPSDCEPDVCLFVCAFNERDHVVQKLENSFSLNYPQEKIQLLWLTDGSDDGTTDVLKNYSQVDVQHLPQRRGKMHAINRGMKFVEAPLVIFSDANTLLGKDSIREIVSCFGDLKVGCVAGEKRILVHDKEAAAGAGEGLYWRMEAWIKKKDAELNSAVGAVGELFAIRTALFETQEIDTLLDDFMISLSIAQKGYKIEYAPKAYAVEKASLNMKEEVKRKVRIATGGFQTTFRLKALLNPLRYGVLSWQYFSHKVMRWVFAPMAMFLLFFVNLALLWQKQGENLNSVVGIVFCVQLFCYLMAVLGWIFENRKLRIKVFFVPFYFVMVNFASLKAMVRYIKGKQSVNWEKAKRA